MKIRSHKELDVYKLAFEAAMKIYELSKKFPPEEKYSLTDQIRRSSRSVCSNLSEGFRKRKYPKSFVAKLSDFEGEAAETQTWLEHAVQCDYIDATKAREIHRLCDHVIGKLVKMGNDPEPWLLRKTNPSL